MEYKGFSNTKNYLYLLTFWLLLSVKPCLGEPPQRQFRTLNLADFERTAPACFSRHEWNGHSVVDAHLHAQPFGGLALPRTTLMQSLKSSGSVFVNLFGIGQILPVGGRCHYYLDCPGTAVVPSVRNDWWNILWHLLDPPQGMHTTISLSFPDLANPQGVELQMRMLELISTTPSAWAGEVNLMKQALLPNLFDPPTQDDIKQWAPFMAYLAERRIPLTLHADLGSDQAPLAFLDRVQSVFERYPQNRIVWAHMGLSKELSHIDPHLHTAILADLLERYPNLYLDISWSILHEHYFSKPAIRAVYVAFINRFPTRILPGSDFVASNDLPASRYQAAAETTSQILYDVSDTAFEHIALGKNYITLAGLPYRPAVLCHKNTTIIAIDGDYSPGR